MRIIIVLASFFLFVALPFRAIGQGGDRIDRMTTYAVILGRATGCGIDVDGASRRVGRWMETAFTRQELKTYLPIFAEGMRHHALQQRDGKSPDSCPSVSRTLRGFPWP